MHIAEAQLASTTSGQIVLGAGMVLAAVGTAIGLSKLDYERVPQAAVLSAAFFVASLIHVPGPVAVHLVLNGLVGLVLGWVAFPVMLIALTLQAMLMSIGGLTAVGLNTVIMAAPAVVCYYVFHRPVCGNRESLVFLAGFAAGFVAVLLAAILAAGALRIAGEEFLVPAIGALIGNLPIAVIDGLVTGSAAAFLRKVRPELFGAPQLS